MRKKSIAKENITPRIVCTVPWRVTRVQPLEGHRLNVEFVDGTCGVIEMSDFIFNENSGVFAVLKNKDLFNQAHIEYGVVTWPGEIDLAPDAMYDEIKLHGKWQVK